MEERNMPRRPRREKADDQPRNESLVYGKNPVTELLKSGSGVDTVLLAVGYAAKGVRLSSAHSLIIAAVTTAVTWLSLALGDTAARVLSPGLAGNNVSIL